MKNSRYYVIIVVVLGFIGFMAADYLNSRMNSKNESGGVDQELLVRPHSPVLGDRSAPVTMVEFLDPECEACRASFPAVKELLSQFQGKVKLVIRYMPFHANSAYAAAVLEEARETGKFEAALGLLFQMQPEWGSHHAPRPDLIPGYLEQIGIEQAALDKTKVLQEHGEKIRKDYEDGKKLEVKATPTFFVNGVKVQGISKQELSAAIEKALRK